MGLKVEVELFDGELLVTLTGAWMSTGDDKGDDEEEEFESVLLSSGFLTASGSLGSGSEILLSVLSGEWTSGLLNSVVPMST